MSSEGRVKRNTRTRCRKPLSDVETNGVPPVPRESHARGETSTHATPQETQEVNPTLTTINLDDGGDDDDVIIMSSTSAFTEVKTNSRRNREITVVVDLDCEVVSSQRKRSRCSGSRTNHGAVINLEGGCYSMRNMSSKPRTSPHPPPPPKEPEFNCPVCRGPLVEETSTKCGHIFCKACIQASIAAQKKCPTCRRKISLRDTIRIYLPATNNV